MQADRKTAVKNWIRRKAVWGACVALGVLISAILLGSCGSQVREGEAPSYLIITSLEGASGAEPDEFGTSLSSDVQTIIDKVPTVFGDAGRVSFRLALKDPGIPSSPQSPSPNNFITVTRYRVVYTRADGRNTPGVDVPHPFDSVMTITVSDVSEAGFELVRLSAKLQAPLQALAVGGGAQFIATIAEVTFYGHDQTGRPVSVAGRIPVTFANFADPN